MLRFGIRAGIPLATAASVRFGLLSRPIFNDSPVQLQQKSRVGPGDSLAQAAAPSHGKGLSRFDGKLDYHQLTFGSFIGMVSGFFFGKVSKVLVTIIVSTLLTSEYLSSSGWLDLKPFYAAIFRFSARNFNQEVMVQDPSFKYSFLAAFLIAAYNA